MVQFADTVEIIGETPNSAAKIVLKAAKVGVLKRTVASQYPYGISLFP
jgi:hypothetical protein